MKSFFTGIVFFLTVMTTNFVFPADLRQADTLFNSQNWFEAIPYYQEALKSDQANLQVKYKLAICYLKLNYEEEAIVLFKELSPQRTEIGLNSSKQLVNYWFSRNDFKDALAIIFTARSNFPNDKTLFENCLSAYENLGDFSSALKLLESSDSPKDTAFFRRKIGYLFKLKRQDEALTIIESGLSSGNDNVFWQEMKAFYFRSMGDFAGAEKAYTSLYLKSSDQRIVKECASMYAETGKRADAARIIRNLIIKPDNSGYSPGLAMLKDLALYEDAIDLIKAVRDKNPNPGTTHELIGLYELTYNYQELASEWIRYLHETGDFDLTKSRLMALATVQDQLSLVTNTLIQAEKTAVEDEKIQLEYILYGIGLSVGDRISTATRLMKMAALPGSAQYILSGTDDMFKRNWNSELRTVLDSILPGMKDKGLRGKLLIKSAAVDFELRNYDQALNTLKTMKTQNLVQGTDQALVAGYEGRILFFTGRYQEALDILDAVRIKTGNVLLDIGSCLVMLGQYDKAMDFYRKARGDPKTVEEAAYFQGIVHIISGEKAKALEDFDSLIRNGAVSDVASDALAIMQLLKNVFSGTDSTPLRVVYSEALKNELAGNFLTAAKNHETIAGLAGKNSFYFDYFAGRDYFKEKEWTESLGHLRTVSDNPSALQSFKSRAMELQGDILERSGDLKDALAIYIRTMSGNSLYARQKEIRVKILELKRLGIN